MTLLSETSGIVSFVFPAVDINEQELVYFQPKKGGISHICQLQTLYEAYRINVKQETCINNLLAG